MRSQSTGNYSRTSTKCYYVDEIIDSVSQFVTETKGNTKLHDI